MTISPHPFRWPVRVYVEDTDFGGVVFYANYLKYFERARTELLRSLGVSQQTMVDTDRVIFVVTNIVVDYRSPARMDEELTVTAHAEKLGRASVKFIQEIWRGSDLLVSAKISIACVGIETMRPQAIPQTMLAKLQGIRQT
jgi:acyl-CoA thioester hydrolase